MRVPNQRPSSRPFVCRNAVAWAAARSRTTAGMRAASGASPINAAGTAAGRSRTSVGILSMRRACQPGEPGS